MSLRARATLPIAPRLGTALLLLCAGILSGCSSAMVEDHMPTAVGGLPDNAPSRPAADLAYPAVHNMPPARATTPLSYDQQKQLEGDLIAARNKYGGKDEPTATGSTPKGSSANGAAANSGAANGNAGSAQNP
jgi:hypothetical protein